MTEEELQAIERTFEANLAPHVAQAWAGRLVEEVRRLRDVLDGYDVNLDLALRVLEEEGIDMPKTRSALEFLRKEAGRSGK